MAIVTPTISLHQRNGSERGLFHLSEMGHLVLYLSALGASECLLKASFCCFSQVSSLLQSLLKPCFSLHALFKICIVSWLFYTSYSQSIPIKAYSQLECYKYLVKMFSKFLDFILKQTKILRNRFTSSPPKEFRLYCYVKCIQR